MLLMMSLGYFTPSIVIGLAVARAVYGEVAQRRAVSRLLRAAALFSVCSWAFVIWGALSRVWLRRTDPALPLAILGCMLCAPAFILMTLDYDRRHYGRIKKQTVRVSLLFGLTAAMAAAGMGIVLVVFLEAQKGDLP